MKGFDALRSLSGFVAFLATWVLAILVGHEAGDYWFWLGLLFGWIPGIVASNLAEKLWPVVLAAVAGTAWWVTRS